MYDFLDRLVPGSTICIDIDRTLLHGEPSLEKEQKPIKNRPALVEALCQRGFNVLYWTGRPAVIEYSTRFELLRAGYRDRPILHVYKGDLLIDDKAINAEDFECVVGKLIRDNKVVAM